MTSPASRRRQSSGSSAVEVGPRLSLRRPIPGDRDEWVALRESNLDHLLPWEPRLKVKSERERWDSYLRTSDEEDRKRFLICLNAGGTIIGSVSLNGIRHGVLQSCDMGYWIGKQFTRRGHMTEALLLAIRHAFTKLELHRLEANVQPSNLASLRVVRKAGLRHEGTSLRFLKIDGKWCDHERWALTVEEWTDPLGKGRPARPATNRRV